MTITDEFRQQFPILASLLELGIARLDEDTRDIAGIAADGAEVAIGTVGYENDCESYLTTHPSPEDW
jgi:hypothetical protein